MLFFWGALRFYGFLYGRGRVRFSFGIFALRVWVVANLVKRGIGNLERHDRRGGQLGGSAAGGTTPIFTELELGVGFKRSPKGEARFVCFYRGVVFLTSKSSTQKFNRQVL